MADPGGCRSNSDRESIIREEVRNCIREELQNSSSGAQSLINRTRNLIPGSVSFAAQNLSSALPKVPVRGQSQNNLSGKLFSYYVLEVPRTQRKVFSRSIFRDNSVQLLRLMHSNVQLLYLLLFIAVGVAVAVFIASSP